MCSSDLIGSDCFFPVCGDGDCNGGEHCFTCEEDCANPADCPDNDGCISWPWPTCVNRECRDAACAGEPSCCDVAGALACAGTFGSDARRTSCPVAHAHRGGISDTSQPHPGILADFGGRSGIERLVEVFYDRVLDDADLAPVFGVHAHTSHGRAKLVSFFMDWFGDDASYSQSRFNGGQQRQHY